MEYILYIRKKGDADYLEEIALASFDAKEIKEAEKVCNAKGFMSDLTECLHDLKNVNLGGGS